MTQGLTLADLTACGAHRTGHFRLSSGLHSGDYLQCALYLARPHRAEIAGRAVAAAIADSGLAPELVVAPALGGLIIGYETARAFAVPFIFTERAGPEMVLRRGFSVAPDQPVVVVEDVVTTGRSTSEVIRIIRDLGAKVLGVASLVNRSGRANPFEPLPYAALMAADFPTWEAAACPLCAERRPIEKPGSRPVS